MQNELVLLHGWGMNQGVWQLILPELEFISDCPVRALDLPGFGAQQAMPESYTLHSAAEQLAAGMADGSTLLGWSLGGLFALYIATQWPEKVGRVILVGSSPFFSQTDDWPGIKKDVLENFEKQLAADIDKTIARFLAIQAMGSESAKQDTKHLRLLLQAYPAASKRALESGLEILQQDDLRDEFARLTIPIRGIFGRLDSLVPYRAVGKMRELNPAFEYEVLDKASHAPFISHKEEFLAALKSML